jgi:hypothetical protein
MALNTLPNAGLTSRGYPSDRIVTPLIINGDMSVAQRSTSASSVSSSGYHALDRFRFGFTDTDQLVATISQDTDVPSGQGFSNSMKFLVTTVETALDADDALQIQYRMEGQNLQNLKYGTSNAESLTLSFWVKSSVTGTYALTFKNSDDGGTKLNVNTYSISSANTWEKKIITISGDTATNIDNTNGNKLEVLWALSAGSNYKGTSSSGWTSYGASKLFNGQTADIATTSSANFYLTGVQLEVGEFDSTSIPSFPFESFDNNLRKCCRYFYNWVSQNTYSNITMGRMIGVKRARGVFQHPEIMRNNPSISANGNFRVVANAEATGDGSNVSLSRSSNIHSFLDFNMPSGSSSTEGQIAEMGANNDADAEILFDAEL